ncbi:MAG: hypothetical protein ATN36_04835 [Epulopiscium sp. Nele67-Bin005]|nr:MAG: hypothetical protein ATN36_04835 [Epulopiscium sp. Nele67-Bin005]
MGDIFKEQLIQARRTSKDKTSLVAIVASTISLSVVVLWLFGGMGAVVIVGIVLLANYLRSFLSREYEYAITNNELDIDVIYNKQRRRRIKTIDLRNITMMASIADDRHKEQLLRVEKAIDCSDGKLEANTYAIIYSVNGETLKILLTPNNEMLQLMYNQAPSKIHKM